MDNYFFSAVTKEKIIQLQVRKKELLNFEEESWHLKIRGVWLAAGDSNTRYFHNFANHRRIINSIWDLNSMNGTTLFSQADLKAEVVNFFGNIYSKDNSTQLDQQLKVLSKFQKKITEEESKQVDAEVTAEEVNDTQFQFAKENVMG